MLHTYDFLNMQHTVYSSIKILHTEVNLCVQNYSVSCQILCVPHPRPMYSTLSFLHCKVFVARKCTASCENTEKPYCYLEDSGQLFSLITHVPLLSSFFLFLIFVKNNLYRCCKNLLRLFYSVNMVYSAKSIIALENNMSPTVV